MTPPSEQLASTEPIESAVESGLRAPLRIFDESAGPPVRLLGSRGVWPMALAHIAADLLVVCLAFAVSLAVLALLVDVERTVPLTAGGWALLLLASLATTGLYSTFPINPIVELKKLSWTAVLVSFAVGGVALLVTPGDYLPCTLALALGAECVILLPLCRASLRWLASRRPWWGRRVIICGGTAEGAAVYRWLVKHPQWGLRPVGIVEELDSLCEDVDPATYLGPPELLSRRARQHCVDLAILAHCETAEVAPKELLYDYGAGLREWLVMPRLGPIPSLWGSATSVAGMTALSVSDRLLRPWPRFVKRALDLACTSLLALATLPLAILIALFIKLGSRGPVFYTQDRYGKDGRRFRAWKFRTMLPNADGMLLEYLNENPALRAEWDANHKLKVDPRVTAIGYWLRKTSLDELPQIWNVFLGEMSLVGPRPLVVVDGTDKYGADFETYARVLPGITGLWQISGRSDTTYEERVQYDAYYIRNWSPWLDLYIIASTIRVVILRDGAY